MKEKDIRERIHTFLRDTVRYVVVPASMGLGLALLGGCPDSSSLDSNPDGSADSSSTLPGAGGSGGTNSSATGGAVALYMAMAGMQGSGGATGNGGVTGAGGARGSGGATGTGGVTGTAATLYIAIIPDGWADRKSTRLNSSNSQQYSIQYYA